MKQSKRQHYNNYFKNNINNIKNTLKGIKWIISLTVRQSETPRTIINKKGEVLTNPKYIANSLLFSLK